MRFFPRFLLSAMDPAHFPNDARTDGAPEIAFLGRSNVGKSSLINKLLGSSEAKVSSTPGRTRAINFFALHRRHAEHKFKERPALIFADLPGYGYAKISKSISAEWPSFIEPYLERTRHAGALHLPGRHQHSAAGIATRCCINALEARCSGRIIVVGDEV